MVYKMIINAEQSVAKHFIYFLYKQTTMLIFCLCEIRLDSVCTFLLMELHFHLELK